MGSWGLRWTVGAVGLYLVLVAIEAAAILGVNDGVFSYTLDDPYVHLELARHLAQGEHGINAGEFSAPASSIVWPLLLVPGWWVGGAFWWPLVLNVCAGLLALGAFAGAIRRVLDDPTLARAGGWLLAAMVVAGNLVPLTFAGMEHTLQTALAAWLAVGLIDVERGHAPRPWLVGVAILLPLVRFECTGVVLLSAAWWAWRGHRAAGIGTAAVVVGALAAYSGWLHAASGFWLPFSVLSKNDMFGRAISEIYLPAVFVPTLLALGALGAAWPRGGEARWLPAIAVASVAGHLVLAQAGLFHRYLGYLSVLVIVVAAWALRDAVRARLRAGGAGVRELGLVVAVLCVVQAKLHVDLPGAAGHIWRMQGQMRRIATEVVRGPVGVNDIGWVSLGHDGYVLDLVGLASPEALRARLDERGITWMDGLARDHDVRAVMIFPHWFPQLPRAWRRVGRLLVDRSAYAEPERTLALYALDRDGAERLRDGLIAFRPSLPDGVRIVLDEEPADAP